VPIVAAVEMKLAHAKLDEEGDPSGMYWILVKQRTYLIPVVTATCPKRLNQPVTQDAKGAP